jgi:hypothetical protein
MTAHKLKLVNPFFQAVWDYEKNFEIRKNDRDYKVKDVLFLYEYDAATNLYLGRASRATIEYILTAKDFPEGIAEGFVILGFGARDRSAWHCNQNAIDEDYAKKSAWYRKE